MDVLRMALLFVLTAGGIAALGPPPAMAAGHAGILFGLCRTRGSFDTLSPQSVDGGASLGATVDFGRAAWPVHVSISAATCVANEVSLGMETKTDANEFSVGAQWYPRKGKPGAQPFLGGGLSLLSVQVELQTVASGQPGGITVVDDRDTVGGAYLHTGVFGVFDNRWQLGVDLRYTAGAEADLLSQRVDVEYLQLRLLAGIRWGGR